MFKLGHSLHFPKRAIYEIFYTVKLWSITCYMNSVYRKVQKSSPDRSYISVIDLVGIGVLTRTEAKPAMNMK